MSKSIIAAMLIAAAALPVCAQTAGVESKDAPPPKSFYQLNFAVREVDGDRVINTRSYSTIASTQINWAESIRAGEKVPFMSSSGNVTQWQQIDVGVGIDCKDLEQVGERLSLRIIANVDGVAQAVDKDAQHPIIRSNRWDSTVLVSLKQPTIIFSSDDPASTRKMQLQITVTPVR